MTFYTAKEKVKIGNECLLQFGIGPTANILCEFHSYSKPVWVQIGRNTFKACRHCIVEFCKITEAKKSAPREPILSETDGG